MALIGVLGPRRRLRVKLTGRVLGSVRDERSPHALLWLVAMLTTLAAPAASAGAQPAAYRHYRTLDTPHFRIVVARGLEREGRVAAAVAETAYAKLAATFVPPRGRVDLLVSDDVDYSNGYAIVSPTNRIVVFATPPIEHSGLRLNEGWLQLVVTHELTHIFHLDRTRGVWRAVQGVFGRGPYFFPNAYGPSWFTEGLAVHEESRLTSGGRLNDALHRMYARAGASGGHLFRLDELSLGTSRFPEGEAAYGYGSLFVDWLARTHGEASIRRFVDAQAAGVVPYWLDPAARRAFGMSFGRAYTLWSDSVRRSVAARQEPLPGWRELTAHGFFATAPRWVNDTTLVYTGGDGRETNAAYLVTTSGRRTRLGRRNSRSASVPMPGGGFLFAQIDYTEPSVIRSDLYVQRDGQVTRLTHGARLIQPDVRSDGEIVAVQLGPARSTLVRVDARTHAITPLTVDAPDDVYAEPRWSPDGRRIAVAHRSPGGHYAIEVWDLASRARVALAEAPYLVTSPSWTPDGKAVVYVSEKSGVPAIVIENVSGASGASEARSVAPSQSGLATPELSRDGRWIAAVELRADGYHLGIAPTATLATTTEPVQLRAATSDAAAPPVNDDGFSRYSPWASLVPRYWYPVIESAPWRGTRLGAITTGGDIAGRHAYSAYLAVPTTGSFPIAGLAYRYAGLRRPLYDFAASQNIELQGELTNDATNEAIGALLKRTRDASLGQTYLYPHLRTSASVSLGAGVEWRDFLTDPGLLLPQLDSVFQRSYTFPRLFVGASWSNVQRPALSISQEDGVSLAFTVRERWRADEASGTLSTSAVANAAGFKSLDLPGFAHHVLALRLAGGIQDRRSGTSLEVGGTSGITVDVFPGYTVGEGRRSFGVRGFPAAATFGTSAAAGSLEYRAPLVIAARGFGLFPLFVDRSALTLFSDYGIADCVSDPLFPSTCAPPRLLGRPLVSTGAELNIGAAILSWDAPQTIRLGLAVPVVNRERFGASSIAPYLAFGISF